VTMKTRWQQAGLVVAMGLTMITGVSEASAQQCTPAVANPSTYERCRLKKVSGRAVCRCVLSTAAQVNKTTPNALVAWGTLRGRRSETMASLFSTGSSNSRDTGSWAASPPMWGEGDAGHDRGSDITFGRDTAPTAGNHSPSAEAEASSAPAASGFPEAGTAVPGLGIAGPNGSIHSEPIPAPAGS
jgi:hypothetical protein